MNDLIIVPIGSYEQHGPHLPPETDYLFAKSIVEKVAPKFKCKVIQGIKIGISLEHKNFKNTKSISKKKFAFQVKSILSNYHSDTKFLFINAHGGNNNILHSIQELNKAKILVLNTFSIIKNELTSIRSSEIGGICHAGEFETSIMLYLFPEKVKLERVRKSDVKYVPSLDPNYKFKKPKRWKTKNLSKSGILGDPFHASKEKGEYWFQRLIKTIESLIDVFVKKYI
ncbi:MAG: creatininase family protein [Candidatus Hermodarchaeota archaeon]